MKDYQKALNTLYNNVVANNKSYEAFFSKKNKLLQELVNKAIPKKSVTRDGVVKYVEICSHCDLGVVKYGDKYCSFCGGKQDWSDNA
jgi:predicted  nucleic acid-binding Zn-ribbon protein